MISFRVPWTSKLSIDREMTNSTSSFFPFSVDVSANKGGLVRVWTPATQVVYCDPIIVNIE